MARAMGPRKVHCYTAEFKLKAVKLQAEEIAHVQVDLPLDVGFDRQPDRPGSR